MNAGRIEFRYVGVVAIFLWLTFSLFIWWPITWGEYNQNIMNDGDTPLYVSYALNLWNCPFDVSRGVMVNAIGLHCRPIFAGMPFSYYLDHPPGAVWLLAPFVAASEHPILIARVVQCLTSLALVLACAGVAWWHVGRWAGIGVLWASTLADLFWFHALSINLQPLASFFTVVMLGGLTVYITTTRRAFLYISLAAFCFGGLTDWPVFFAAGPVGVYLLWCRRWRLAFVYTSVGTATLLSIFVYFTSLPNFDILKFFHDTFVAPYKQPDAPWRVPVDFAIEHSFIYLWRTIGAASILLLGFVLILFVFRGWRERHGRLGLFFGGIITQGFLNQFVFIQWAGTHNYWNYYYMPAAFLAGGVVFYEFVGRISKMPRPFFLLFLIIPLFVNSGLNHSRGWRRAYSEKPVGLVEYLNQNNLESILDPNVELFSDDDRPFFHLGFKLRMLFDKSLRSIEGGSGRKCEGAFTILKSSTLSLERRASLPEGVVLDLFDWYVIPTNIGNPECRTR